MRWDRKDLLNIGDFDRQDFDMILALAEAMEPYSGIEYKAKQPLEIAQGYQLATAFFEPSTRTRLSFQTAMQRLGGTVITHEDPTRTVSSAAKGESDLDTLRMLASYSDILAIRHPVDYSVPDFAEALDKPVINGGDGRNQHPTQTILDLYTIQDIQGRIDGQRIVFVGDLMYGRTVHSLAVALRNYNHVEVIGVCPRGLEMPEEFKQGITYTETVLDDMGELRQVIGDKKPTVVYATRVQRERLPDGADAERFLYTITPETMSAMPEYAILMHPLPRPQKGKEHQEGRNILLSPATWDIDTGCDSDSRSVYFQQAAYGVPTRMAVIALMLAHQDIGRRDVYKRLWSFMTDHDRDTSVLEFDR